MASSISYSAAQLVVMFGHVGVSQQRSTQKKSLVYIHASCVCMGREGCGVGWGGAGGVWGGVGREGGGVGWEGCGVG